MEINLFLVFTIPFSLNLFYILCTVGKDDGINEMLTDHKSVILAFIIYGILTIISYDPSVDWNTFVMLVLSLITLIATLSDFTKRLVIGKINPYGIVIYSFIIVLVSALIVLFSVILMRSIRG